MIGGNTGVSPNWRQSSRCGLADNGAFFARDHIAELSNTKPKQPFFFLKPPSSIVLPGEGPCLRPKGVDMHFEVELALVIGKMLRDHKAEDEQGALEAIQGE